MKVGLSIRDVLAEVDFELAQGVVARQDLRRAIREIRRLHERNRQAVFGASATGSETATPDLREALRRQFQVDDMILAVLGEAVSAAEEARERSRRLAEFVRESLAEVVIEDEAEADSVTPVGAVAPARRIAVWSTRSTASRTRSPRPSRTSSGRCDRSG